jgi:hypothetical protein
VETNIFLNPGFLFIDNKYFNGNKLPIIQFDLIIHHQLNLNFMEPIKDIVKDIGTDDSGKAAGIISYFTLIGWLIAYFGFHHNKKLI